MTTLPITTLLTDELNALLLDSHRLQRLERYLRIHESSVFHMSEGAIIEADWDEDELWSGRYTIGHTVETEHRGCYRFEKLGGHRRLGPAIDLAMDAWEKDHS